MYRLRWIILVVLVVFTIPAVAQSSLPGEFTIQTDPVSLIGAYYNAINLSDYARAYSYWERPPFNMTESQFAAGFADTYSASVIVRLPIFVGVGAGNAYANIPTLVSAQHRDGTAHYYAGCFTAHKVNVPVGNATEPDPNWHIQQGRLREYSTPDLAILDTVCEETADLSGNEVTPGQYDPVQLIQSYFQAAAAQNMQQAAGYWENPPGDLFAAAYGSLLNGAQKISLYVNPVINQEGAAGSVYASIPALSIVTTAEGTPYAVTGCYTARRSNVPVGDAAEPDPNWRLTNAALSNAGNVDTAVMMLSQVCNAQTGAG